MHILIRAFAALLLAFAPALPAAAQTRPLLIENVRLIGFAGESPSIREGMAVAIADGRIVAVGKAGEVAAPDGAQVIDGAGRTMIPGLVDMHVHVWDDPELGAYLAHGVTLVRNMSGMPYLLELRDAIARGDLIGPRIITTGPILNGSGPNAQINHQIVDTPEAARRAVRWQYERGFRRLKVYSNLSRAAYDAIRDEAGRLGMTITGHTPEGVRDPGIPMEKPFRIGFDELLDDGFVTIEHVESIVWHGLYDRYDEGAARTLARRIAAAGVPVDVTLLAFANLQRVAETRGAYLKRPGTETLNPFVSAMSGEDYARWTGEDAERAARHLAFLKRVTAILAEEGVMLVTGTDAGIFTNLPGAALIEELKLLVDAGLSPYQALRASVFTPHAVLGEGDAGRIAPGQRADLLLIDGDPLSDVSLAGRPHAVIRAGRWLDAAALAELRAGAARTDVDRSKRRILAAMGEQALD